MNTHMSPVKVVSSNRPRHEQRRFYLDWLKVLAVLGVFAAHNIDALDIISWRIRYQEQSVGIMTFTNFGAMWGMSLMFLLAGSTTWFALGSRNGGQFINERIKRLLIPFLVGVLFLSPVEAYFEDLRLLHFIKVTLSSSCHTFLLTCTLIGICAG
ncbi:hypothetical protein KDA_02850 [Dictyobacter alpinus]|uniref:Acyltransferase 3 domain-containing protein n=1 Tax=Dictyobacter alpinus TaxID=2014873 RepID=A0A402B0B4_9CHLR|nr:acyltransferase family protein [Dictyobacter alpinus]GCE24801.1 hypothetical protein KDA_02850 [Dictyobacter alpinus]